MARNPLVGAWRLLQVEGRGGGGEVYHPFGEHPSGMLIYDAGGSMAVTLMRTERTPFPSMDATGGTQADMAAAYREFEAYSGTWSLVRCQGNIDGFSWSVGVQGKAPLAANGYSLRKSGNAAMDADRPTLRASLWCPAAALRCLTRGWPLPAHRALRQNITGTLNPSILP